MFTVPQNFAFIVSKAPFDLHSLHTAQFNSKHTCVCTVADNTESLCGIVVSVYFFTACVNRVPIHLMRFIMSTLNFIFLFNSVHHVYTNQPLKDRLFPGCKERYQHAIWSKAVQAY